MGLDTSHDCWSGAYSAFDRWRTKVCEVAGYGVLDERQYFGGSVAWPSKEEDPLVILLTHSDCDGEIKWQDCTAIADKLEALIPALTRAGEGGGHIGSYAGAAQRWVDGLREAAQVEEDVDFH